MGHVNTSQKYVNYLSKIFRKIIEDLSNLINKVDLVMTLSIRLYTKKM